MTFEHESPEQDQQKRNQPPRIPGERLSRREMLHIGGTLLGSSVLLSRLSKRLTTHAQSASEMSPANPIVVENMKPGSQDWIVTNNFNDIEGFVFPPSAAVGQVVQLFVNTTAEVFDIDIYRIGYYGGMGGRLVQRIDNLNGIRQDHPHYDPHTGLSSCSNWISSLDLHVPNDWMSGIYIAKLTRPDTGGENYALFVVKDSSRHSALVVQTSLFTHHAYNNYGGKSLYYFNSGNEVPSCNAVSGNARAVKVSLMRPFSPGMDVQSNDGNSFFRVEYPMVRWLEAQGYDVSYVTDWDTHYAGLQGESNHLLEHRTMLCIGHDEYWTQEMRDAITQARDGGVNLGFFGANIAYWRVRLEDDPWSKTANSVIVTYKTTEGGPPDPSGHATGTWRDPAGVNDPENALLGNIYIGDNDAIMFPLRISSEYAHADIYRHTDLQTMPARSYIDLGKNVVAWEWDAAADNGVTPPTLEILAASPVFSFLLQDAGDFHKGTVDQAYSHVTRYTANSGARVYALGTIQWSWGLGANGIFIVSPDLYMQQITYNILADLGVQPASPVPEIVLDGNVENRILSVEGAVFVPADSLHVPEITALQITMDSELLANGRGVKFTLETDVPTIAQLWTGESANTIGSSVAHSLEFSQQHELHPVLFWPERTYFYRILIMDEQGSGQLSDPTTFTTPRNLIVNGGVFPLRIARSAECLVRDHPAAAAGAGVGGLTLLASAIILGRRYLRRRNETTI